MSKGLAEWKRLYQRALAMSSKELAVRLRQQATARADLLRYKVGIGFESRLVGNASVHPEPNFFFAADVVPLLCSQLRETFPAETDDIIARAERICRHRFDLLGYRDLDYGLEIDWHSDQVHGKQAPRKPWFQIHYLDFEEVGDSKLIWEINRHQHLVTLAKAHRLTGETKFADELFSQWKHWHRENPYPIGINWASSLEVAFRSLSWMWVYYLMAGSGAMPEGFRSELLGKLGVSARHIECHLSTYFSANTHLLGEGVALFFIGTLCPELAGAELWRKQGWRIVEQEAERQVRPDGLHFEQSTYYHVYALDFFLHSAVLAKRNGITISAQFDRTLERMLEGLYVLGRLGPIPKLGDDDGGRLFDGRRNGWEHLLDPLATGAVMFGRGDFKAVAGGFREETLWLLGETGRVEFERLPVVAPVRNSIAFESTGLYGMTDDGGRQLVIDAGPQGAGSAGHGHADALSILANSGGRPLLIDSGTFEYVGKDAVARNRFRGTRAHNTLVVDGRDQGDPKGPFSWARLPKVRAERSINGETFDFFVGSHDGYTRLAEPVVHRRSVFSRKSRFWLVRDQALGRGKHQLDLFWHVSPELLPMEPDKTVFRGAGTGLSILAPENGGSVQEILQEDWSPVYGQKQTHRVVHFARLADLPEEFVTLLIPDGRSGPGAERFVRADSSSAKESAVCYRFNTGEEEHFLAFGQGQPWTQFSWSSDAEFLYWSQSRDRGERTLICCNGSYVEADGRKILSSGRTLSRCELLSAEGNVRVISSNEDTVVNSELFALISHPLGDNESGK
jgi:hypothetical protein